MSIRDELAPVMADQLLADLQNDLSEDEIDERMMAAGVAALNGEERAMEMSRRLYLHAAALCALVSVGLSITPAAGAA